MLARRRYRRVGNRVVLHSIFSIASSGSRPDGRGFFAAAFQSLLISPRFAMRRNSAPLRFTVLADFRVMILSIAVLGSISYVTVYGAPRRTSPRKCLGGSN
jgi:hypothetical protein